MKQACGPKVEGSLRSGVKGMVVGEDVVALAFSEQYAFARDMVDTVEMRDKISRVFTQFLGRSVSLLVQTGEQAVLPNVISVLDEPDGKSGPDPLVEFAVNDLGAKVVDNS